HRGTRWHGRVQRAANGLRLPAVGRRRTRGEDRRRALPRACRARFAAADRRDSSAHCPLAVGPASSRYSQAFALFHSRITVIGETRRTSAVSSTPKKRSSTTFALRDARAASAFKASSREGKTSPFKNKRFWP